MLLRKILKIFALFKKAYNNLSSNDPLRMAAATSFFTFFALPPISIILSKTLSVLLGNRDELISGKLFHQLAQVFGSKSAHQLENISENLQHLPQSPLFTFLGVFLLLFSATTLFAVIQRSLNQLWNIKQKTKRPKATFLQDRLVGLAIIVFSGVLFLASFLSELLLAHFQNKVEFYLPESKFIIIPLANHMISVVILTLWFGSLFKYLPNLKIGWKAIWVGSLVTAVLYKAGAFLLEIVLSDSQAKLIFGASASRVLVLLFIFYASLIFYYGAAFTKVYSQYTRLVLRPTANAITYQITEIDTAKN